METKESSTEGLCLRERLRLSERLEKISPLLLALGDETRQRIFNTLITSERGEMRVGEIVRRTHFSRSSVSHHLQVLRNAGLVVVRKEGTRNWYSATSDLGVWNRVRSAADDVCAFIMRHGAADGQGDTGEATNLAGAMCPVDTAAAGGVA